MGKPSRGPWVFDPEASELTIQDQQPNERNFIGRFHAGQEDGGSDARPLKANGYLMAAAPLMLEALEELEWAGWHDDGYAVCPMCSMRQLKRGSQHADDCLIERALTAAQGKAKWPRKRKPSSAGP